VSRCPGDTCPLAAIIARARGEFLAPRPPRETVIRTLSHTNLRRGAPSLQAPVARVLPAGTDVVVDGFIDNGEPVQGNAFWYCDDRDGFFWAGATNIPEPTIDDGVPVAPTVDAATTDPMEHSTRPAMPSPPPSRSGPPIDRTRFVLPAKEFAGEVTRKDMIVLHFTAGTTARSAFDAWRNDPLRVATAYLVDVDGTIYEVFPPHFWAAHLGVKGTKNAHDRRSIGIEIANVGPLRRSTENSSVLNWWPRKSKDAADFTTPFCRLDENDRYLDQPYRGMTHFASFPAVQIDAVGALVRSLCDQFSIRRTLPPLGERFECAPGAFATYKGICTHANFRQDKWDIGPAFPWERLAL
jgi:N-acetyl-anhydromuramyl-L-alanine amidase AmpD